MRILVLDNYDSFTYNLVHYLEQIRLDELRVVRHDVLSDEDMDWAQAVVISPGPGIPQEAGRCMELISQCWNRKPMLGVCLGHQALALHTGGMLRNLERVHHGVESQIRVVGEDPIFKDLVEPIHVGRYHSWIVDAASLPHEWLITSVDEDGEMMSMRHRTLPHTGVQFHPESIMTRAGLSMLKNWVNSIQ